jgi:putative membrane protein
MRISKSVPTLIFSGIATVAVGCFVSSAAMAADYNSGNAGTTASPGISHLLNKANAINYEEIQLAKMAQNKAGDNQALLTFAKTMQADHEANEDAVTALSNQKNVKINPTPASMSNKIQQMQNLNGAQFDSAMINAEVQDHQKALKFFEGERGKVSSDPHVALYVDETIPVLRAHLQMAKALQQHMGQASNENPENNKSASR